MSKRKDKIKIRFIGQNAEDVTGSMILIEMQEYKILLECGLYQSNNIKNDYKINSRKFDFKPSEIDYVFINHGHIDHIGKLPALYAKGCEAKVIAPTGTSKLFSVMGADSAFIMGRDVITLKKRYGMKVSPIYTTQDVVESLRYFQEYGMNQKIKLNDAISFRFVPSGHIIKGAQLELWLTQNNKTTKILYTSDLGNISVPKYYTEKFQPVDHANIVIAESTYADKAKSVTMKSRDKDLEKIRSVVETVCLQNNKKVLIPVFSLDRAQNILTHLYDMFGKDKNFKIPVLIDSPLTIKLTKLYSDLLEDEDLEKFKLKNGKLTILIRLKTKIKKYLL